MQHEAAAGQPSDNMDPYRRVRRAFRCGVDAQEFRRNFDALSRHEKYRLDRVAQRLWASTILRHHVRGRLRIAQPGQAVAFDSLLFHAAELPSLEIFYLFGCLDTLASTSYQRFPDWLRRKAVRERLQLDGRTVSMNDLITIYDAYEGECGVGSNLRRLFSDLPEAVSTWLTDNVRVVPMDEDPPLQDDAAQPPEHVTHHLYLYFYRKRRNPFAHESVAPLTDVARDVKRGVGWHVLISNISTGKRPSDFWAHRADGRDWIVYLRNGIDEATVLRMIVHGVGLQRVGIEVTDQHVGAFFNSLSRQAALYGFLDEIRLNALSLSWWAGYDETGGSALHAVLDRTNIPQLVSTWAAALIERYRTDYPLEHDLHQMTREYIEAVMTLNATIVAFNAAFPPPNESAAMSSLPRRQQLAAFVHAEARTPVFSRVVELPLQPAIKNLVRHADEPCWM